MAITPITEDYIYPQHFRWYNEERRENRSYISVRTFDDRDVWDFVNSPAQKHVINLNNDITTPIQLMSYANGVKIKYTYDRSSYSYDEQNDKMSYALNVKLYDKDGDPIPGYSTEIILTADGHYYTGASAVEFYYTGTNFGYSENDSQFPIFFHDGGTFFSVNNHDLIHENPVPLTGEVEYEKARYNWMLQNANLSGLGYNDYMSTVVNNGDGTPITPIMPEDDTSHPQPSDPDYDPYSDPIDFPGLPTGGDSISTGFIRVYTPSSAQLQSLASVLWSDNFFETIKKIQNDPMEAIISLHSIPFSLIGTSVNCRVGNFDSGVSMPAVNTQFYTLNLGSIYIPEHWGSALDYSPYVTVDMFLPFVGVISLQVDDIVNKTVSVKYNVDILSGATLVSVKCNDSVLYTYNTNIILRHPISQSSYGPLYQSILGMVGSIASGVSAGGMGGAVGGAVGGALNVAMSKHSNVNRGGSIGGATGVLGNFTPYLIFHRPKQSLASGFKHFKGYPSNITVTLGSLSGYTEVEKVHLTGINCTDIERDEISSLLYNGVIF